MLRSRVSCRIPVKFQSTKATQSYQATAAAVHAERQGFWCAGSAHKGRLCCIFCHGAGHREEADPLHKAGRSSCC